MSRLREAVKKILNNKPRFSYAIFYLINHFPFNNHIKGLKGNQIECEGLLRNTTISIRGQNNSIVIGKMAQLYQCSIQIMGNNCRVRIGDGSRVIDGEFYLEDCNSQIAIGKNTSLCGKAHLAAIEGCSIQIGNECMFSSDITIRTGDSHPICDFSSGERVNVSKDVWINNHVWIGNKAIILKGCVIGAESIVGAGAVVANSHTEENVILAGNPAKIVKKNIFWKEER